MLRTSTANIKQTNIHSWGTRLRKQASRKWVRVYSRRRLNTRYCMGWEISHIQETIGQLLVHDVQHDINPFDGSLFPSNRIQIYSIWTARKKSHWISPKAVPGSYDFSTLHRKLGQANSGCWRIYQCWTFRFLSTWRRLLQVGLYNLNFARSGLMATIQHISTKMMIEHLRCQKALLRLAFPTCSCRRFKHKKSTTGIR
jgi:hypothetical protein